MSLDHDEKDAKGERNPFEVWAVDQGYAEFTEDGFHFYEADPCEAARKAWQAARADTARIVAEASRYRFLRDTPDADFRPFALRRGTSPADADAAVDARMRVSPCDRCGNRVDVLKRTTAISKYQGCDVCANCLEELEPGRARSTQPDAGTVECGCCATGCPAGQCRHAKENP